MSRTDDQGERFVAPRRNARSFVDNMRLPLHRWFRYSAAFSAQWVESVVPKGARVLDPFAGSATTLLASQAVGAESYGIDSQPFVSRVGRAKLRWASDPATLLRRGQEILARHAPHPMEERAPALLEKCYAPATLADLLGLRDLVLAEPEDDPASELLWLAFVSIIRPTSQVGTAQWQNVLPNKRSTIDVCDAFGHQLSIMSSDMRSTQLENPAPPLASYVEGDARDEGLVPDAWATHIVCSPPYANDYDYADATQLEQTVLGEVSSRDDLRSMRRLLVRSSSQAMEEYDPAEAFDDQILAPIIDELGTVFAELDKVRHEHGGKKAYHTMVLAHFHDLAYVWRAIRKGSASGVRAVWVVGDSAPYGVYVPVERWLAELALAEGFDSWSFEKIRDRNVERKNREHDVPLHEGLLVVHG